MWEKKKVAVYTGTKNLYRMMVPAVKSLLTNSDVDDIYLYIEDDVFPKEYGMPEEIVHVVNCKDQKYFKPDGPNMKSKFTYMALMRAAMAKEFENLDRILALDVDTIVVDDISKLWDLPLGDKYYLAASEEPGATEIKDIPYYNIGVCLYNLEKLRDGKCDEVIEALNTKEYKYMEQDAFSELCQGAIYDMPSMYNSCDFTKPCSKPKIAHFAGYKKWDGRTIVEQYMKSPWKEVMKYRKWRYEK